MHTGILWQAIYWLSSPVLAVLVTVLIVRKLHRSFPVFFVYIIVLLLIDIARLLAYQGRPVTYFYTYWISDAVGTLFAMLAAGELVLRKLFPHFYKIRFYLYLFLFAALIVAAFTVLTAYSSRPPLLLSALITVLHITDFVLTAALLFFVALMVFMGRSWGPYEFGIAMGLGVNAAALLATFAVFSKSVLLHGVLRHLTVVGEDAASIIWLISFLRSEKPSTVPTVPVKTEVLQDARKWEETLKDSLTGKKRAE